MINSGSGVAVRIRKISSITLALSGLLTVCVACNLLQETPVPPSQATAVVQEPLDSETAAAPAPTPPSEPTSTITQQVPADLTLVYTSAQDLIIFADGKPSRLTSSADVFHPRISPDGELIAFLRPVGDIHLEIWCINRDGSDERPLVTVDDMNTISGGVRDPSAAAVIPFSDFRWLPGTHTLAFTSQQIYQGPGSNLLNDLVLVNADTGDISLLFLAGWGGLFSFSSDGKKVAISQPDKILLANSDGSGYQTALSYDPVTTYSEYRYYAAPIWSPDGTHLMVAIPPVDPLASPAQNTELWRIASDGSAAELQGTVEAVPFMETEVRFSPNLEWVAYISGELNTNQRILHLAKSDGSSDLVVAEAAPLLFQGWAPDSRHFLYTVGQEYENWLGGVEDKPIQLPAEFRGGLLSAWIDSSQFIFWRQAEGIFELWYGKRDGTAILLDEVFDYPPSISILN